MNPSQLEIICDEIIVRKEGLELLSIILSINKLTSEECISLDYSKMWTAPWIAHCPEISNFGYKCFVFTS